jgi:hypothetical protein
MSDERRIFNDAPMLPVDWPVLEEGQEIRACNDCYPWFAEVILDHPAADFVYVREWHAVDCPALKRLR